MKSVGEDSALFVCPFFTSSLTLRTERWNTDAESEGYMLTKICSRCGKIVKYPMTMCEDCEKIIQQSRAEQNRKYNKFNRDKDIDAFYHSAQWKLAAKEYLRKMRYRCEDCGGIATNVHHAEEVRDNWERRLDPTNFRALCDGCHNRRHPNKGGWNRKPRGR